MSKTRKTILLILTLCLVVSSCFGLTFAFADDKTEITFPETFGTEAWQADNGNAVRLSTGFASLSSADLSPSEDALRKVYVLRGETKYACTHVYEWEGKLTFYFFNTGYSGTSAQRGDRLVVESGFEITHNRTGYISTDGMNYVYDGTSWTKGTELPDSEEKTPLSIKGVYYTPSYAGFAGDCIYVDFGESTTTADWAGCSIDDKVVLTDANGVVQTLQYLDTQGNYLLINRSKNVAYAKGWTLTIKSGFAICHADAQYTPDSIKDRTVAADVTYVYDGTSWTKGTGLPDSEEKKPLEIKSVNCTFEDNWYGASITVEFNEKIANKDWAECVKDDGKIILKDADGKEQALQFIDSLNNYLFINRGKSVTYERGWTLTFTSDFTVNHTDPSWTVDAIIGSTLSSGAVTYIYDGVQWAIGSSLPEPTNVQEAAVQSAAIVTGGWSNDTHPLIVSFKTNVTENLHGSVGPLLIASVGSKGAIVYKRDGVSVSTKQIFGATTEIWAWFGSAEGLTVSKDTAEIGDVVEIPAGFIFQSAAGNYYRFSEAISYVYNGTEWLAGSELPNQPEMFEIDSSVKTQMYVGAVQEIKVNSTPETAIGLFSYSVSDDSVVKISKDGVLSAEAAGSVKVTVKCNGVVRTLDITVVADDDAKEGLEIASDISTYYVPVSTEEQETSFLSQGYSLQARYVFKDGLKSAAFAVTEEEIGSLDYTTAGQKQLVVTDKETGFTANVAVVVYEYTEFGRFNSVGISGYDVNDGRNEAGTWNGHMIISMNSYSTNGAYMLSTKECGVMAKYIEYTTADGKTYLADEENSRLGIWVLMSNILVMVKPDGADANVGYGSESQWKADASYPYAPIYKLGDKITFKKGMPFYAWKGEVSDGYMVEGTGCMIVEGYLSDDFTYICYEEDGTKSLWQYYMEYTDFTVKETIEIVAGKAQPIGAAKIPSDATTGTFSYEPSDPSVVTVNETGTIIGMKPGTATVTVTLSGGKDADGNLLQDIVKVVTVTVKRGVSKIEGTLSVKQNATVDLSQYEITVTYTDGTTETIKLNDSRVQVQGIDTSVVGTAQYNVLITLDGQTYREAITVDVTGGCGSSLSGGMLFGVLMLAVAFVIIGRKKKEN